MLTLTDCGACEDYERALVALATERPTALAGAQLGKLVLDRPGAHRFKQGNRWLSAVRAVPCTLLYVEGRIKEAFTGARADELAERIGRLARLAG